MAKHSGESDIEIDLCISYVSAPAVKFQNPLIEVSLILTSVRFLICEKFQKYNPILFPIGTFKYMK